MVANLTTASATTELPAFNKTSIPIGPNDSIVESTVIDVPHCHLSTLPIFVLHKTETTGCLVNPVKAHNNATHLASSTKELPNLFLSSVEGQIANIQSGRP